MKKRLFVYCLLLLATAFVISFICFPKHVSHTWTGFSSWLSIKRSVWSGWASGEPMFKGKPASYWSRAWKEQDLGFDAGKALADGGHEAIPVIVALLHDPEPFARSQARTCLDLMEPPPVDAIPGLIDAMRTEWDERILYVERTLLEKLLRAEGKPGDLKPAVLDIMHTNPNPTGRHWAVKTTFGIAEDKRHYVNAADYRAPDVIAALRESLHDPSPLVQIEVADVLWQFEKDSEHIVPVLAEIVQTGGGETSTETLSQYRRLAIPLLARLGKRASSAAPALLVALKDENAAVRQFAASALGSIGALDANTLPTLATLLKDSDNHVRRSAAQALAQAGPAAKDAVPQIVELLKDEDYEVREAAANVLGKIGGEARSAVPALRTALKDSDNTVRVAAARALLDIDPQEKADVVPTLRTTANAKGEELQLRLDAAQTLWTLDHSDPTLVQVLPDALKDSNRRLRMTAVRALERLGPQSKDVIQTLTKEVANGNAAERTKAAQALAAIGSSAKAAVPALQAAAKDKDETLRQAATDAIQKITAEPKPRGGEPRPQRAPGKISG
jgi:HEAT repeat protein